MSGHVRDSRRGMPWTTQAWRQRRVSLVPLEERLVQVPQAYVPQEVRMHGHIEPNGVVGGKDARPMPDSILRVKRQMGWT